MKTSELTGAKLDWAVAKCEGLDYWQPDIGPAQPSYSSSWPQGGLIIERERIDLWWEKWDDLDGALPVWCAQKLDEPVCEGFSPLIAAMRCYVASKLGDEVTIPDELMEAA